ncbi:MAG: hypothetical protein KC684_05860 [Candidatus Omnitrophica bacterium]|nr:hypothetical protein [Candidatus Omnitrophota bacterium]
MKRFYQQLKFIIPVSIGLSCFFHIIVSELFVFTFPLKAESFKPGFTFLGAILDDQELDVSRPTLLGEKKGNKLTSLDSVMMVKTGQDFKMVVLDKPQGMRPAEEVVADQKATQKLIFSEDIRESEKSSTAQDIGIDLTPMPYKPLRLQTDDIN